ncbi:MAG: hypothetical protein LBL98_03180 [Ruminococcus sp.]|nr:hypothetical protein [Ruminococcus sp.]
MIFLNFSGRWNKLTGGQKALVIAAVGSYALTFLALLVLAFAAVLNINDPQDFGIFAASLLGVFFVAITVDVLFAVGIIRSFSSDKEFKEEIKLLESEEETSGDRYYYFNRSLRDNIMCGNLRASEEDYNRALDTINLPERPINDNNTYISESDKQKIVLARMLLSKRADAPINAILNHCDSVTKLKILQNIYRNYPEIKIM